MSIGVLIPTFNGEADIERCLTPLLALNAKILVIDSSSSDETTSIAKKMGVEVMTIHQKEFNHGLTREKGRKHLGTDIVVMMTQDAQLVDPVDLEKLIAPLQKGEAVVSYARQIPKEGATFFEAFAREFNYPKKSEMRSFSDGNFFCSNSCAAYLQSALDEVGGFPKIAFGEDAHAVAKLLQAGHQLTYVAEVEVVHSHRFTLKQEFLRHIAIGASRKDLTHSDAPKGRQYVKALLKKVVKEKPHLIFYALLHIGAKALGYYVGRIKFRDRVSSLA